MYGSNHSTDDIERTAFRKAEKKYNLYYDNTRKKKQAKPVDLSEVIDFKSISESYKRDGELPSGIFASQCDFHSPIFCLETYPGFYFIPEAITVEEQCRWIKESLTSFPQPPNRTNHYAIYGPLQDLFTAAKMTQMLSSASLLINQVKFPEEIPANQCLHRFCFVSYGGALLACSLTGLSGATIFLCLTTKYLMHLAFWRKKWRDLPCHCVKCSRQKQQSSTTLVSVTCLVATLMTWRRIGVDLLLVELGL